MIYQEEGQWWGTETQPWWSSGRVLAQEDEEDGIGYYGDTGFIVDSMMTVSPEYPHPARVWMYIANPEPSPPDSIWDRVWIDTLYGDTLWTPIWGNSLHEVAYPCNMGS